MNIVYPNDKSCVIIIIILIAVLHFDYGMFMGTVQSIQMPLHLTDSKHFPLDHILSKHNLRNARGLKVAKKTLLFDVKHSVRAKCSIEHLIQTES